MNQSGCVKNGCLAFVRPDLMDVWLERHEGLWFRSKFEVLGGEGRTPKSKKQLGYYHGLLLPEIHQQLVRDGHTVTIEVAGIQTDIPVTKDVVHEYLTALCGHVGDDGEHLRMSDQNQAQMAKSIDAVLNVAAKLRMNMDNLKAWRPR